MSLVTLEQRPVISVGDGDVADVDMTKQLASSETIASATVSEITTTDLTLGTPVVNTAVLEVLNKNAAIGKAASFSVSGQKKGTTYSIKFTMTTSNSRIKGYKLIVSVPS